MDGTALTAQWEAEERFVMEGWDFSHIDGRWDCPDPPWDYRSLVKTWLRDGHALLDMGTGGGEVLLTLGHPPANTAVTEAYPPNLALCRDRLAPLGITVAQTFEDDRLPFGDETFDIVINRHESFDLAEVARVLRPGGYFITQQVGGRNSTDLAARFFPGFNPHNPAHQPEIYRAALERLGFAILAADEVVYPVRFFDVGAFVFYARSCPWEFPDFSVAACRDTLLACQEDVETTGALTGTGHRFLLAARKH